METIVEQKEKVLKKESLWNANFLLLWQGQLVSAFGDVIYEIALGFWILAVTGSTALMGTLMAVSTLPRILIAPFAGVFVDRSDRKKVLFTADILRGIFVTFIGIAAYMGFIKIWMVFAAGIIINICGAFFNPAVNSSLPDITPKSKIIKANSLYSMIYTGSNIVGSSAGGVVFKVLGAPIMFLVNGISYLFSAITILFIKIPKLDKPVDKKETAFFKDMKEGLSFVWRFRGLRNLIVMAAAMNFFGSIGIMLLIPLFNMNENLGPVKYGIATAIMSAGMFLGMLTTSIINIKTNKRYLVFVSTFIISVAAWAVFPLVGLFPIMVGLMTLGGFLNAIFNVLFSSTMQLTVPQESRGKVFSLIGAISSGLTPIAFAVGGIIAEFIPVKILIPACFFIALLIFLPIGFTESTRRFIGFDPEKETLEDIVRI